MHMFANNSRQHHFGILFLAAVLSLIGTVNILSTTYTSSGGISRDFYEHLGFLAVGWGMYFGLWKFADVHNARLLRWGMGLLLLNLALMVVAYLLSNPALGPRRWINLGVFSLQPAELLKITVPLALIAWNASGAAFLAALISKSKRNWLNKIDLHGILFWVINCLIVIVPTLMVVSQPSLGNGVVVGIVGLVSLFVVSRRRLPLATASAYLVAGILLGFALPQIIPPSSEPLTQIAPIAITATFLILTLILNKYILKIPVIISIFAVLGVALVFAAGQLWANQLTEYQRDRITSFFDPNTDPLGAGWQTSQATQAIISGGLWGQGILQAERINLRFVTYAYTDFAYTAISAQLGIAGSTLVLILFGLLVYSLWCEILVTDRELATLHAATAGTILLHVGLHVAMNLEVIPVSGIPLSLISYGGSHLLTIFILLGLSQAVYRAKAMTLVEPPQHRRISI
jgi:rod shape determining protein RodA